MRDIRAKSPSEMQKRQNFQKKIVLNAEFLEVSHKTSLVAKVPNWYFGSRVTTHAKLNEIVQYFSCLFQPEYLKT
jgi:hypothetical protein